MGESTEDWSEKFIISFCFKPNRVKKIQFQNIGESVEARRKNLKIPNSEWSFIPISGMDGIVEYKKQDGEGKCIIRTILSGNWMIIFCYDFNSSSEEIWKKKRELWMERLQKIQY